jgi:fatty-acyl-CoA synthase
MSERAPTVTDLLLALRDVEDRGVHFEDSFVSWREHLAQASAIGTALHARLDPGRPPHIGLLLQNTPAHSAVLAAAALTGLVTVGLNPVRRGAALARDVANADCQLVLTDSALADVLGDAEGILVDSPAWAAEVAGHAGTPVPVRVSAPADLLLLMLTSGTSGEPKAARCSQGKVAEAATMMAGRFGLGPRDTCYVSMPMFHSNAVLVGWAVALACGGSLALRRTFSASQFIPDVRRYGATYANYVGKPLSYVLATPARDDDADNPLRVVYGNEAAARDIARFARRFDVRVVDGFGSTEGGVAITRTPDTPPAALGPLPDGIEIRDVDTDRPCPPGVIGELVNTAGPGRFEGYYNNAAADAERMRGGCYRSGDLAYLDEGGFVHFAGRVGDWLRVDGENLGSAPIERVLLRHPDVVEAAVYGVPAPDIGDRVMAALVLTGGATFDPAAFRDFLAAQTDLGPKQWPSYVRVSPELPRTETFKVIKRRLVAEGTGCADPVWTVAR